MRSDLSLHEQVLLLSLRDDTGKQTGGTWPAIAIAGALLSELWLAERITLEKPKRTVLVTVSNRALTGEGIVDEALQTLSRAKRRAALSTWVTRLSGTKKLVHRVTEPLVRRGILKRERAPFLLFFERTVFPTVNPGPERRLIDELGQAIRMDTDPGEVPTRTRLILGIADSTGLLRANFDKKELKRLKRRIQSLKEADPFAQAVGTAVAGIASG